MKIKKNAQFTWIFVGNGPHAKKIVGAAARAGATHAASIESISLRRLDGVAQGLIGSNRSN